MLNYINVGATANDGTGDLLRDAFIKVNGNLTYLESLIDSNPSQAEFDTAINNLQMSISNINTALNGKSNVGHTHTMDQILGLVSALGSKVNLSTYNFQVNQFNIQISEINQLITELFTIVESGGSVPHNELQGLQGGDIVNDEMYHLSLTEYNKFKQFVYVNGTNSLSISPTTGERGVGVGITLTYNLRSNDDTIISSTLTGQGSVLDSLNQGTQSVFGGTFSNNTSFTLSTNINRSGTVLTENKTSNYTSLIPQWVGVSSDDSIDQATYSVINSILSKRLQASSTISVSLQPIDEYIYWFSTNANATITNNGFPTIIGAWNSTTAFIIKRNLTLTLQDGSTTANLTVYRTRLTSNLSGGAQNFTIV